MNEDNLIGGSPTRTSGVPYAGGKIANIQPSRLGTPDHNSALQRIHMLECELSDMRRSNEEMFKSIIIRLQTLEAALGI